MAYSDFPPFDPDAPDPNSPEQPEPLNHPHIVTSFYGHIKVVDGVAYLDMQERGVLRLLESGSLQEYQQGIIEAGLISADTQLDGQRLLVQFHFLDVQGQG